MARGVPGKDKRRSAYAFEALIPYLGHLRLIDVDDGALQQYKEDRRLGRGPFEKPAMVGTINKELTLVTTVLNRAVRVWRWIPSAPQILHVEGARRVGYPLTWEEQSKLFQRLPTGWDVGAAVFAVNTGVRRGELFGLKWDDMVPIPELETFVFILRETKNGESRAVICNSIARRAVNAQRDNGSAFVFPSKAPGNRGQMVRDAGKIWLRAWKDAGLPSNPLIRKGIHNLRHTFATRLRAAGVSIENRNALLGHAKTNIGEHYAQSDIARLLECAELVTQRRDSVILRSISA